MTQFTKSFIWRFILDILLLGFVVRIVTNVLMLGASRFLDSYSAPYLVIKAVISAALSMLFICYITNWNIDVIDRKGCMEFPNDTDKWFRNFSLTIIGVNVVSSMINYLQWRSQVKEKLGSMMDYVDSYSKYIDTSSVSDGIKDAIASANRTLIVCLILQNVVGIAILYFMLPRLKNKLSGI